MTSSAETHFFVVPAGSLRGVLVQASSTMKNACAKIFKFAPQNPQNGLEVCRVQLRSYCAQFHTCFGQLLSSLNRGIMVRSGPVLAVLVELVPTERTSCQHGVMGNAVSYERICERFFCRAELTRCLAASLWIPLCIFLDTLASSYKLG
jgi:hypothetical protein